MSDNIKPDDARVLLQSTQQLRIHWSWVITTHMGYAIVLNVGIWSFFLKSYIDSLAVPSQVQPLYVGLVSILSATLLGLWRLYTHFVDNSIAGLYPDFLLYENILSGTSAQGISHGTSKYLTQKVPWVKSILLDTSLTPDQKLSGIKDLVGRRRIGDRGHLDIDFFVLVILGAIFALNYVLFMNQLHLLVIAYTGIGIGLYFLLRGLLCYQRDPSEKLVKEILSKLKGNGKAGT